VKLLAAGEKIVDEAADGGVCGRVTVDEIFQCGNIVGTGKHLDDGINAVAAGATDFLAIILDALGQVVVVNVANVGFVDTHAEGDGCDDDAAVGGHPALLHGGAFFGVHAGMVGFGL